MNPSMYSLNNDQLLGIFALSTHPAAMYTTGKFVVETANDAMLKLWNRDKSVLGLPLEASVPELSCQAFLNVLKEVWVTSESRVANEVPVRTLIGGEWEWMYYDIDCQAIKDQNGDVYAILQTAVNVTNRSIIGNSSLNFENNELPDNSQQRFGISNNQLIYGLNKGAFVENSEDNTIWPGQISLADAAKDGDRLKRFFMQAPAGICILDGPEFIFEMVNGQYQQLFPGRRLLGLPVFTALPELKGEAIEDILHDVYQTGRIFEGKELLVPLSYTEQGQISERYFNFIYQPRRNSEGLIDGVLVFVTEVTETVLNRKKIEEKEADLRSLVMASAYGLMILRGREYVIEVVNQQIANLWQKVLPEITGKKLLDVLPEIEDQPFPALLEKVYTTGIGYGQEEEAFLLQTPAGPVQRYVSFYYDPLLNAEGEVSGILVACEDITEKIESRSRLQESYEEQQALNEELASTVEELAAVNEEIEATNEELKASNEELAEAQISLRKMIQDFEESENKVRAMVSSAPFPIGVYEGPEMHIALANKAIMDVWGKGYDVLGKRYADLLPELENQDIFEQLDAVFITGVPFHARNQRVDLVVEGKLEIFYFNYSFTPLLDRLGKVYGIMNTASDVTDLYLAKQKIEQNERNLHNMILQSPVAMCILSGPEHVITVANPLMIEVWGKPTEQVMNKPVFEALPDAREQGLEQVMAEVYQKGMTFRASEMPVRLLRKGKQDTVYQNFVYEPHRDSEGNIIGIIAITIDVTEQVISRKKIEQSEIELLEIKKQLEAELEAGKEIQRQKDSFIGIASHELKTPLTSLTAIIQVASRKLKNSDDSFLSGAMEKAQLQVKRMHSMISGFLNISRLESGKMLIDKQIFDMEELVKEVVEEIEIASSAHSIQFSGCGPVKLEADRDKVNSVVSNLLTNAIKYSPLGKVVLVNIEKEQNRLLICVEDKGIGIKPEDQSRIFDRYYRVGSDHTQHISGFGIGLYLSAEIVRLHGGEIWVESELGKGSKFCFTLPLS